MIPSGSHLNRSPLRRRHRGLFSSLALPRGRATVFLSLATFTSVILLAVPHLRSSAISQIGGGRNRADELAVTARVADISSRLLEPWAPERQLRDQVFLGKAYLAQAQLDNNAVFAASLQNWIHKSEAFLASSLNLRATLRSEQGIKDASTAFIENMSLLLLQAREYHYDSAETLNKLREKLSALESKVASASSELASVSQVAAESVPRSIMCLSVSMGSQYKGEARHKGPVLLHEASQGASMDPSLYHFCIFSDNLMALAVAINSSVQSAAEPHKFVFHVISDVLTFPSIHTWFSLHKPKGATLELLQLEDVPWMTAEHIPVMKQMEEKALREFYFSANAGDPKTSDPVKFHNPKYMSMMNHGRFYLPQLFPALPKMVLLDDDIVVQKDLSPLFDIDMQGGVNGAVETCVGQFHRFRHYLNFSDPRIASRFDPEGCGWAFGMNILDLRQWRAKNVTGIYHFWQEQNADHSLWKLGTLPVGLLTFYGLTHPIDRHWHVLGLGYNKKLNASGFADAAAIHFNGNLKPWLKIAIPKYKKFWTKYLDLTDPALQRCGFA